MSRIVTLYSYRGGTGKSTCAVNLACLLAADGERVAVLDTDLASPAVHTLLEISGVGPSFISKYAEEVLALIAEHPASIAA